MRLLLFLCAVVAVHASESPRIDLLIAAADDETLAPIINGLENKTSATKAGWTSWSGSISGKSVMVTRTEGDPLNAVAAVTLVLRSAIPKLVLVYGICRPHDLALKKGDVVVSSRFVAFDGMISPPTALGAGTNSLAWSNLPHAMMTAGETEVRTDSFPADASARTVALTLSSSSGRVLEGVLGSAAQINREPDRIAYLRSQWQTSTEDGESAFVAGCAQLFAVPVVGIRVVDGTAEASAKLALEFIAKWK